jgi:hypothetical protein
MGRPAGERAHTRMNGTLACVSGLWVIESVLALAQLTPQFVWGTCFRGNAVRELFASNSRLEVPKSLVVSDAPHS